MYVLWTKTSPWDLLMIHMLFLSAVVPALVDRLGDSKDQVREQSQAVILKLMEQSANPMVSIISATHTHTHTESLT